uniref:AlNc14C59G4370 protein n=1 Tax=Albugo laibachii Nc14 TaxID=890382 RepID=F0WCJ0_9STRA|nr:AlNc14C59G4370 [Albugo laibachii Nc14]|eukprot:CCA18907.1 AlNc14C59G4370 [Albugo laibachii Nc14]
MGQNKKMNGNEDTSDDKFIDIDESIKKMRCAKEYLQLEDCLVNENRDWTKCQIHVKALKCCHDGGRQSTRNQESIGSNPTNY